MADENGAEFTRSWAANAALLRDAGGIDLTEHDACGVGLVAALDGKPRREVVQAGIDALKRGVAPRRGGRRRQDRRRRRHPCRDPAGLLRRGGGARRRPAPPGPHRGRHGVPAQDRPRRAGALPADRRDRDPRRRLQHLLLAAGADRHRLHRREGQRDPAGDRADPALEPARRRRRDLRARPLRHPPAHRAAGDRGADPASSTSARCPAARSSTRACSSPST